MSTKPTSTTYPASFIHLISGLAALFFFGSMIFLFDRYTTSLENKSIYTLASMELPQTYFGSVIQQAAVRKPDLLPIIGSSEMLIGDSAARGTAFFAEYPTGFNVINISNGGNTSLNMAQDLAAIGPSLKGRKIVISFTPIMFTVKKASRYAYNGNFSRLHAVALVFSPNLSLEVKELAARRMVEYPEILSRSNDFTLQFALRNLAGGTILNRIAYSFVYPLGMLDSLVLHMQDHFEIWSILHNLPAPDQEPLRNSQTINWEHEISQARARQAAITNNNPYGIENASWINDYNQLLIVKEPGSGDNTFIASLQGSKEWNDLEILLIVLKELGAKPLLLSRPFPGTLYVAEGVSPKSLQYFYTRLENLANKYAIPVVTFQEYTNDPYFSIDTSSHPSQEGWMIVNETLDGFYHDSLPAILSMN